MGAGRNEPTHKDFADPQEVAINPFICNKSFIAVAHFVRFESAVRIRNRFEDSNSASLLSEQVAR